MFALIAAVLFIIGAIKIAHDVPELWLYLGLAAWALHFAIDYPLPITRRRQP